MGGIRFRDPSCHPVIQEKPTNRKGPLPQPLDLHRGSGASSLSLAAKAVDSCEAQGGWTSTTSWSKGRGGTRCGADEFFLTIKAQWKDGDGAYLIQVAEFSLFLFFELLRIALLISVSVYKSHGSCLNLVSIFLAQGVIGPGIFAFAQRKTSTFLTTFIMARSPVLSFLLFGALVLLGKRSMESFVGSPATQRRSVVARRAEEEEEPEKVAAPGDRLKLKAMGNGMDLEMELFKL